MKSLIFLLLTLPLLATSCQDDDPPLAPIDQLPPATQTGAYTFGCLVNGEAFVPENTLDISAIYQGSILQIGAGFEDARSDQNIGLILNSPVKIQSYNLTNPNFIYATFNEVLNRGICWYEPENTLFGTLTITHFDSTEYIVSGTFEFTTATEGCDTIRVTDGRFDLPYIP